MSSFAKRRGEVVAVALEVLASRGFSDCLAAAVAMVDDFVVSRGKFPSRRQLIASLDATLATIG